MVILYFSKHTFLIPKEAIWLYSTFYLFRETLKNSRVSGFPGGAVVKNPPANAGDRVRALGQEDPTCRGATKPVHDNYWAWALDTGSHNYWAPVPQLLKPAGLEPMLWNKRSHHNEKRVPATKSSPHSPQLEKAHVQQRKTQHRQK